MGCHQSKEGCGVAYTKIGEEGGESWDDPGGEQ